MMLLLLLSALVGLTAGEESFTISSDQEFNMSSLPIQFFGQKYNSAFVTTLPVFSVCFKNYSGTVDSNDCVKLADGVTGTITVLRRNATEDPESLLNSTFPELQGSHTGHWKLAVPITDGTLIVYLFNFGTRSFVLTQGPRVLFTLQFGSRTGTLLSPSSGRKTDISGCYYSGQQFMYNSAIGVDNNTCTRIVCDVNATITEIQCSPTEECKAGSCIPVSLCTLVGPSLIAYQGTTDLRRTRCEYSLVNGTSSQITVSYRERRDKGLSFADSVTLVKMGRPDIILMQDGRVMVNDKELPLNSSVGMFDFAELSKDPTGITAELEVENGTTAVVFFDGYTVQIKLKGTPPAGGLCLDNATSTSEFVSGDPSCATVFASTNRTDCSAAETRCDLLNQAPFTACNAIIDPTPYITQCKAALCIVEAEDGLDCQFHEAYARACGLRNITVTGWMSGAGCSPSAAFGCAACASNEFCHEDRCMCRALFAEPFRASGTLGDQTVCNQSSASVTLYGCLLVEKNIDPSTLHLKNQNCTGLSDPQTGAITFSFDDSSNSCGTVVTTNSSILSYKNTIQSGNSSSGVITRHDQFSIDFSCYYTQPEMKTVAFRIKDSSIVQEIVSGAWNYTLTMAAFSDPSFTQALNSSDEVLLNQKIYVELATQGLSDSSVSVVTDSCWATSEANPNATVKYNLIENGCANSNDKTVTVHGNGDGNSNSFSFNMFQFSGSSTDVYLHCKLNLCVVNGNNCVPSCVAAGRRRRSARNTYEQEAAFISMSWTN